MPPLFESLLAAFSETIRLLGLPFTVAIVMPFLLGPAINKLAGEEVEFWKIFVWSFVVLVAILFVAVFASYF